MKPKSPSPEFFFLEDTEINPMPNDSFPFSLSPMAKRQKKFWQHQRFQTTPISTCWIEQMGGLLYSTDTAFGWFL